MTKIHLISQSQPSSSSEATEEVPWPDLKSINTHLPPVKSIEADMLPDEWHGYLYDKAHSTQSNIDHLSVMALSAYGATLGRNIRIRPRRNMRDYEVVPNPWSLGVAPPSLGKTPIFNAAIAPLRDIEKNAIKEHLDFLAAKTKSDEPVWMQIKGAKKRAQKLFDKGKTEEANAVLDAIPQEPEPAPPMPAMIADTTTIQALGETLKNNPAGIALFQDELAGFFSSIDGREKAGDRAFYLTAYNGLSSYRYDTISRGTLYLPHVCLTVAGFIQPSKIAPIISAATSDQLNDGMIQRFQLMVMPDPITDWKCVDQPENTQAKERYFASFRKAYSYRKAAENSVISWSFSPQSQRLFSGWLEHINTKARSSANPSALESHLIKLEKTVASIAVILEIADGGLDSLAAGDEAEPTIGVDATKRALKWAAYLETHARRIYGATEEVRTTQAAANLVLKRHSLDEEFSARDVYRNQWQGIKNALDAERVINLLLDEGYLRTVKDKNNFNASGRCLQKYRWNPKLDAFLKSNAVENNAWTEPQVTAADVTITDDRLVI